MKKVIAAFVLSLLSFGSAVVGQTEVKCPTVSIAGPSGRTNEGTPITFSVNVTGSPGDYPPYTFAWSVSAGMIDDGQGTRKITVDTKGVGNQKITASVQMFGFDSADGCNEAKTHTAAVVRPGPPSIKVDEYGKLGVAARNARLDKVLALLQKDPAATLYVIYYQGRKYIEGEAKADANWVDFYLRQVKKVPNDVQTDEGGFRETQTIELFIGKEGAMPPMPTPTVKASDAQKLPKPPAKP